MLPRIEDPPCAGLRRRREATASGRQSHALFSHSALRRLGRCRRALGQQQRGRRDARPAVLFADPIAAHDMPWLPQQHVGHREIGQTGTAPAPCPSPRLCSNVLYGSCGSRPLHVLLPYVAIETSLFPFAACTRRLFRRRAIQRKCRLPPRLASTGAPPTPQPLTMFRHSSHPRSPALGSVADTRSPPARGTHT